MTCAGRESGGEPGVPRSGHEHGFGDVLGCARKTSRWTRTCSHNLGDEDASESGEGRGTYGQNSNAPGGQLEAGRDDDEFFELARTIRDTVAHELR